MKVIMLRISNDSLTKLNYQTIKQIIMSYPKTDQQLKPGDDMLARSIQLALSNIDRLEQISNHYHKDLQAAISSLKHQTQALYSLSNPHSSVIEQPKNHVLRTAKKTPKPWRNISK